MGSIEELKSADVCLQITLNQDVQGTRLWRNTDDGAGF